VSYQFGGAILHDVFDSYEEARAHWEDEGADIHMVTCYHLPQFESLAVAHKILKSAGEDFLAGKIQKTMRDRVKSVIGIDQVFAEGKKVC
jgi:hypothetical protein